MDADKPKRLEWTAQQAIVLYLTIEALLAQFESENRKVLAQSGKAENG